MLYNVPPLSLSYTLLFDRLIGTVDSYALTMLGFLAANYHRSYPGYTYSTFTLVPAIRISINTHQVTLQVIVHRMVV